VLIIPAIDLLHGKVVRLTQGDYNQVDTYSDDPVTIALRFQAAGAPRIHVVDLDGAKAGHSVNAAVVTAIASAVSVPLELGGGIRTMADAERWWSMGVEYVILGSLVIQDPVLAESITRRNPGRVIVGLDAHQGEVAIGGWQTGSGRQCEDVLKSIANWPLDSVIFTDIATDGTLRGPNMEALSRLLLNATHPVIASGGIGTMGHIHQLCTLPLKGCIVGKALLSGALSLADLFGEVQR